MTAAKETIARPLTLALAATMMMWVCAYGTLLFSGKIGGEILFVLSALCLFQAGRHGVSKKEAAMVGFLCALLNLLLIGSIIGGNAQEDMFVSASLWVVGLFAVSIALSVTGNCFNKGLQSCKKQVDWQFSFFAVSSILVFLMLVTGGLVTGLEAGLAVPDWPNSYGHNMLLYPLTEMISNDNEGVFFEHAHRLTGMFVGLTSLIMLVCSWKWSSSKLIRIVATLIFILVCIQGLLGGLRVTGFLTMTQDRAVLTPNVWIGVVHGVVGQLIFAICICLTALWSAGWNQTAKICQKKDSKIAMMLCLAMVLQLVLGALYRHMIGDELLAPKATHVLFTHIVMAVAVFVLAIVLGIRLMGRNVRLLKKIGMCLHLLVMIQLLLGGGALIVILVNKGESVPLYEVLVTTAHQANGALLLGASFLGYIWTKRLKGV